MHGGVANARPTTATPASTRTPRTSRWPGALQGLSIDEAHLDAHSYGATIRGGKDITVGAVHISIDASSTADASTARHGLHRAGAQGNVTLRRLPQINRDGHGGTAGGRSTSTPTPTSRSCRSRSSSPATLHVTLRPHRRRQRVRLPRDADVRSTPAAREPGAVLVDRGALAGGELTGTLTAAHGARITRRRRRRHRRRRHDRPAARQDPRTASCRRTTAGGGSHAAASGGLDRCLQLGGRRRRSSSASVTGQQLEGEVEAAAGSGGAALASESTGGPIRFGAMPRRCRDVTISHLSGNRQSDEFHVQVQAGRRSTSSRDGMQRRARHRRRRADHPRLRRRPALGMHVAATSPGHVSYAPGGSEKRSRPTSSSAATRPTASPASSTNVEINAGEGFHSRAAPVDLTTRRDRHRHRHVRTSPGAVTGTVNSVEINLRHDTFNVDADVADHAAQRPQGHDRRRQQRGRERHARRARCRSNRGGRRSLIDGCSTVGFARGPGGGLSAHLTAASTCPRSATPHLRRPTTRAAPASPARRTLDIEPFAIFAGTHLGRRSATRRQAVDAGRRASRSTWRRPTRSTSTPTSTSSSPTTASTSPVSITQAQGPRQDVRRVPAAPRSTTSRRATVTVARRLRPGAGAADILRAGSMLTFEYANKAVRCPRHAASPRTIGPVHFDDDSHITVELVERAAAVHVNGTAHADINKLAHRRHDRRGQRRRRRSGVFRPRRPHRRHAAWRSTSPASPSAASPATCTLHVGAGARTTDFNVSVDADVTGIPRPASATARRTIHGELRERARASAGYVQVARIKIGDVIADGRIDVEAQPLPGRRSSTSSPTSRR